MTKSPGTPSWEKQTRINLLAAEVERLQTEMAELKKTPTIYGYIRVSSKKQAKDGNSLAVQKEAVSAAGAQIIFTDVFTGTTTNRPQLDNLLSVIKEGDTLIIAKLDRIARSVQQGIALLDTLASKGIRIQVLNMGTIDDTPTGRLIRNVMLAIAEFDRDMILQRTSEGRELARQNPNHREGRKEKYSKERISHALDLLKDNTFNEVARITGISRSTLLRAAKKNRSFESRNKCEN